LQISELIVNISEKYDVSEDYKAGMNLLAKGSGDKNMSDAVGLFVKAALSGESAAQYVLSRLLIRAEGTEKYQAKAVENLKMAADGGIAEAQYDLAVAHILGGNNSISTYKRLNDHWDEYPYLYLKPTWIQPELLSAHQLVSIREEYSGKSYKVLTLTQEDLELIGKSSNNKLFAVISVLPFDPVMVPIRIIGSFRVPGFERVHYLYQLALQKDWDQGVGIDYLKRAADNGLPAARSLFGNYLFFFGSYLSKEGLEYILKAAEDNDPEALIFWANLCINDLFKCKDLKRSLAYFDLAADQDDIEAFVAKISLENKIYGSPKNKAKALKGLSELAARGWPYPTGLLNNIKQINYLKKRLGNRR
jgi:TPR repeat protein